MLNRHTQLVVSHYNGSLKLFEHFPFLWFVTKNNCEKKGYIRTIKNISSHPVRGVHSRRIPEGNKSARTTNVLLLKPTESFKGPGDTQVACLTKMACLTLRQVLSYVSNSNTFQLHFWYFNINKNVKILKFKL